jgi:hypothetical protein
MKHMITAATLALAGAVAFADTVTVTPAGAAIKAAIDKDSGRLRPLSADEQQALHEHSVSARLNAGLGSPTVTISKTGVGDTERAELGLAVLDELVVHERAAPTHQSVAAQLVTEDK